MKRASQFILLILLVPNIVYAADIPSWSVNILNRIDYMQGDKTVSQVTGWQEQEIRRTWLNSLTYSDFAKILLSKNRLFFFNSNHQYQRDYKLLPDLNPLKIPYYHINEKGDRAIVIAKTGSELYTLHLFAIHGDGSHTLLREIPSTGYIMGRPSISRDGNTILWFEAIGGGGQKIFVLKNASNPDSKPVELVYVKNIGDVLLSGDGNWAYSFVWNSRVPNQSFDEGEREITLYSHYENGVWSEMKSLVIDGETHNWGVADTNYDSSFLYGTGVVERKGDYFTHKYLVKTPRDPGLVNPQISEDGKSVIFNAVDKPHYKDNYPDYYERRPDALVLAVHENETDEFATNYILDEGYYMQFAYSKLTENILWTAYDTDPFWEDWGAVEDWALREENQN